MIEETLNDLWQATAITKGIKQMIRDVCRITLRNFTAKERLRIVLEGFRRDIPITEASATGKTSVPARIMPG